MKKLVYSVEKSGPKFSYILEIYFNRSIEDAIRNYQKLVFTFYSLSGPSKRLSRKPIDWFIVNNKFVVSHLEYRANLRSSNNRIYIENITVDEYNKKLFKKFIKLLITTRYKYMNDKVLTKLFKTL